MSSKTAPYTDKKGRPDLSGLIYTNTRTVARDDELLLNRRVVAHVDSQEGNVFRVLRSQILRKLDDHNISSLAIVGSVPSVGKSMVATNLSVSISQDIHRTALLVDLDLRKPKVGWYFGVGSELGVADFLVGRASFPEILVNPGFERLVIAPGTAYSSPTELLGSQKTEEMLHAINGRYESRVVVYDLPPLLGVADALAVIPHVDAALIVLEDGKTSAEEVQEMKRLLGDTPILGAVVNKSDPSGLNYYYNGYYYDQPAN